jgi:hypothetical protein
MVRTGPSRRCKVFTNECSSAGAVRKAKSKLWRLSASQRTQAYRVVPPGFPIGLLNNGILFTLLRKRCRW